MNTTDRIALLRRAYRSYNERDIEAVLAMVTDDVEWPDVANHAVLHGKEAIRSYWTGPFIAADPA